DDLWPEDGRIAGLPSKSKNVVEGRRHVADAGDAVFHETRQNLYAILVAADVNLHVPETGNQELSSAIDHNCVPRNRDATCAANRGDLTTAYDDGHGGARKRAGAV